MTVLGATRGEDPLRDAVRRAAFLDEGKAISLLLDDGRMPLPLREAVSERAKRLLAVAAAAKPQGLEAFLQEYSLSSQEGIVLMCLAEALLRIPDDATRSRLIRDRVGRAEWARHQGRSESFLVNASTWALMLTGRMMPAEAAVPADLSGLWSRLFARSGEAMVRRAVVQAIRILGRQFVMGETVGIALDHAQEGIRRGYRHCFDMLGDAARTAGIARDYLEAYSQAVTYVGCAAKGRGPISGPGLSVKLSALHPRYEFAQRDRVMTELVPRLLRLAEEAANQDIGLCVDAEESDRLDLSLDVLSAVMDHLPRGWEGFGVAIQAYQKRAPAVIDWLIETARARRRRFQVRLVKGAYWETEIRRAQERGLPGYPVFTRKAATDLCYQVCARRLAAARDVIFPQFATHNAQTIAAVVEIMGSNRAFEFQRLHGIGAALHDQVLDQGYASRVYAPVGQPGTLLPYLVRRLLENGANGSVINRHAGRGFDRDGLAADPADVLQDPVAPDQPVPLPDPRWNTAAGLDLSDPLTVEGLTRSLEQACAQPWVGHPVIGGVPVGGAEVACFDPALRSRCIGTAVTGSTGDLEAAVALADVAQGQWDRTPLDERAARLERAADLFEQNGPALMARCVREAGKTIPDALAELRDAQDYLRFYARRARQDLAPGGGGLTGAEAGARIEWHGRGVFACISPWNFPLSIFTGQIAAALAAGNAVVAKPAAQTPLVSTLAVSLLHQAGIPGDVLALVTGDGHAGARLLSDRRVQGVAFTGSNETAWAIQRGLSNRRGPLIPLIAETGGLNGMIADSTASPEQVVADAVLSAFSSAGQRPQALRLLFVQEDIAASVIDMMIGAMRELSIGDPANLSTDVGPVIDGRALATLDRHRAAMNKAGRILFACPRPQDLPEGNFFMPHLVEIDHAGKLEHEVFGPFLHVVRYPASGLPDVLGWVRESGYGLTLGVHSRIEATVRAIVESARVGNVYVNRSMSIAQGTAGEATAGAGSKGGGGRTLMRFVTERAISGGTLAGQGDGRDACRHVK